MDQAAPELQERRYRIGLLTMRGGLLVALLAVLLLPAGEGQLLLFLAGCVAVAWGAWRRRHYCPVRRSREPRQG